MNSINVRLVLAYVAALLGSLWLSYQLRFDFAVPEDTERTFLLVFGWVISFKLVCLWRFRQFDVLLDYFSVPDFSRLFWVLFAMCLVVLGVSTHLGSDYAPPRSVVLIDFSFSLLGLTGLRLALRRTCARATNRAQGPPRQRARRAGIIGAGLVGTALAQEFAVRRELGLQAVAFL
ncbi:MAG TPA: polysaccharide biosynthesis protein, partial [Candidatus Dormibacteraeota bacterium]|nr:polysaccharide biosynthesis protein [Candidatus Dormibacteraeota bacterium]